MELSEEQEAKLIQSIVDDLLEESWARIEGEPEEIVRLSVPQLAGMLDLCSARTRHLLIEHTDVDPQVKQVTLAQARQLVEACTVQLQNGKRGGR